MIHILLISMMISQTSLSESEKSLPEDLMNGLPMVGDMRDCDYQGKRETKVKRHISREEAVEKKMVNNQVVLSKVRESEYSNIIHEQTIDEAARGRMTPPRRMKERDIKKYSMARRLGVREERLYEAMESYVLPGTTYQILVLATRTFHEKAGTWYHVSSI